MIEIITITRAMPRSERYAGYTGYRVTQLHEPGCGACSWRVARGRGGGCVIAAAEQRDEPGESFIAVG